MIKTTCKHLLMNLQGREGVRFTSQLHMVVLPAVLHLVYFGLKTKRLTAIQLTLLTAQQSIIIIIVIIS